MTLVLNVISEFRTKIEADEEYHLSRRDFYENYEWLEAYWRDQFNDFDSFCREYGPYFWSLSQIRDLAKNFAFGECVGSSYNPSYEQTQEIAKATMYLRYKAGLMSPEAEIPDCSTIGCRYNKSIKGWCNEAFGDRWPGRDHAPFKALMYIVRQIRNNLFHGNKIEFEHDQYERNKILVQTAASITKLILEELQNAEAARGL